MISLLEHMDLSNVSARSRQPILTVRLGGGLGNQLFQYAFGRRMSLVNHLQLYLDASGYENVAVPDAESGVRMLSLDHFQIVGTILRHAAQVMPPRGWIRRKIHKYWNRLVSLSERKKPYYLRKQIHEPVKNHFIFDPRLYNLEIKRDLALYGYWQTEKYFADIEQLVRTELVVKDALDGLNAQFADAIRATNSVSIHVRHGDNANVVATALGVLPAEYFQKAIANLSKQVSDPHFYIFSDDIPWARELLVLESPKTFVAHNGDARNYEDLRLMSFCKHHILGNSTFSWWGAWLGRKEGQIVYAPRRYYQNIDRPNPDLYPESWRLI